MAATDRSVLPTDLTRATAAELSAALRGGEVSAVEVTQAHLDRISAVDGPGGGVGETPGGVHVFLHVDAEGALAAAKDADQRRAAGEQLSPLAGVPIAVKDLVCTEGLPTTAASRMLANWISPYDATITTHMKNAGMPILGKTNLDEFAMGSSTEHSAFGPSRNPWDLERIPGGSGGGSAAALAAFEAPLAIGTDTGGSIRQPAAVTGTVGVKPTYGSISRFGIIALASSLDTPGPCARTVLDAAMLHEVIGGYDPLDSTSLSDPVDGFVAAVERGAKRGRDGDLKGLTVGLIKELSGDAFQREVSERFNEAVELLRGAGANVVEVSCPNFEYAMDAYYLIMSAEASSNLARYDGVRYGLRVEPSEGPVTMERMMAATRGAGFGGEVKRRIILGTHALSSGYVDAYYLSAQRVRTLVQRDFAAAFGQVDVLVSPTVPTSAFKIGEKIEDIMAMYLNDIATIPANMAGVPAISLPTGLDDAGLPVAMQVLAPAHEDNRLYEVAGALEVLITQAAGGALLDKIPALPGEEGK